MNLFEPNKLLNYDDASLINEVKRVYDSFFQGQRMTGKEFTCHSRVHYHTVRKRFGSWSSALKLAGIAFDELPNEKEKQIPFSELKKDIENAIAANQGEYITYSFYKKNGGQYSHSTILKRFGYEKWADLLNKEFSLFIIRNVILPKQKIEPVSEEKLFNELRIVWDNIGRRPTYLEFKQKGNIPIKVYERRYGTWTKAIEIFCTQNEEYRSGSKGVGFNTTKELLIQELNNIVQEHGLTVLNQGDYEKYGGQYTIQTFYNHFGSWKNAKIAAGLKIARTAPEKDELLDELQKVWEQLGRQPLHNEIKKYGKYSHKSYQHVFGSWTKAIYAFITDRQNENIEDIHEAPKTIVDLRIDTSMKLHTKANDVIKMKTPRIPSTRLRFNVLSRDKFTCVFCNKKPSVDSTIILHVDHIRPYSKGGETILENLQTTCSDCNLGKSDTEL